MKKIKMLLMSVFCVITFNSIAQSKIAHINTTELVASMPEMNEAKSELES